MNREIRTDLAIELRESVGGNTEMEGVRVKTVVNEDKSIRTTTIDVINEAGEKNLKKAKQRKGGPGLELPEPDPLSAPGG